MGFLREFHKQGKFVRSLNATFLVLIGKKKKALTTIEISYLLVWWEAFTSCWLKS